MKTVIATSLLLASTSVLAHDNSFSSDSCNVELEGGISISKDSIVITEHEKPLYKIVNNKELYIDDENIPLSESEQALVTQYSNSIRAVVPEVKVMALNAMDLAVDGVNLAFNELLGEGNTTGQQLTAELSKLRTEIETKFNDNQTLSFDENGFNGEEFFGEEFEQRIESLVETTVQNSMGSLLIAVGQELLFAGGSVDALETRMEKFGEQIESEMETRAEAIEIRADELCNSIVKIDQLEEALKQNIDALSDINFLTTQQKAKNSI